eukprot:scaffold4872_cov38-Phaeocystis_antarctica.AAC.2
MVRVRVRARIRVRARVGVGVRVRVSPLAARGCPAPTRHRARSGIRSPSSVRGQGHLEHHVAELREGVGRHGSVVHEAARLAVAPLAVPGKVYPVRC